MHQHSHLEPPPPFTLLPHHQVRQIPRLTKRNKSGLLLAPQPSGQAVGRVAGRWR